MIWPSDGAWESLSTLARRMASELAQPAWPSTRLSQTGRCGADRVEHGRGRERAARPEALVPVPAGDPRVGRGGLDPRLDPPRDFVERRHAAQVELFLAGAQRLHVPVGIDQARASRSASGRSITRVDGPRNRMTSARRAHGRDRAAARGQRLGPGIGAVAGPDPLHLDDQVGGTVVVQPQRAAGKLGCRIRAYLKLPAAISATPLTNRYFTPGAYRVGWSKVAASRNVSGSKTTMSAIAPCRITPRSGRPRISAGKPEHERIACSSVRTLSSRA